MIYVYNTSFGGDKVLEKFSFNKETSNLIKNCKKVFIPKDKFELIDLSVGGTKSNNFTVKYDVGGKEISEATVVRCKNGVAINYPEDYMRRRDPDCLIVADENPTDKPRFKDIYKENFDSLRTKTLNWLEEQELIIVPFMAGGKD